MWPTAINESCFNLSVVSVIKFSLFNVSKSLLLSRLSTEELCAPLGTARSFEMSWEQLVWLTPAPTIYCVALELVSFWRQCCFCTAAHLWPKSFLHSLFYASVMALFLNFVLSTGAFCIFLVHWCHSSTADTVKEFWTCVALNCITYARAHLEQSVHSTNPGRGPVWEMFR